MVRKFLPTITIAIVAIILKIIYEIRGLHPDIDIPSIEDAENPKQYAQIIAVLLTKNRCIEAEQLYKQCIARFGKDFKPSSYNKPNTLSGIEKKAERERELTNYPKIFKGSWIYRMFTARPIRLDPPSTITLDSEKLIIQTRSKIIISAWSEMRILRSHIWIWPGGRGSLPHISRQITININQENFTLDCSDRFGDFDFPVVFIDELKIRQIINAEQYNNIIQPPNYKNTKTEYEIIT